MKALSAAQIAELRLPGLPATDRGIRKLADRENWPALPREGRGGGVVYPVSALPKPVRLALVEQLALEGTVSELAAESQSTSVLVTPVQLAAWQRRCLEARAAILAEVDRLAQIGGVEAAIRKVIDLAAEGRLRAELQELVPVANARAGKEGKRTLSRRSLYRWRDDRAKGTVALAPREAAREEVPAWAPALLKAYRRPQNPSLQAALEGMELPAGVARPSYDQARRFLKKLDAVERHRGRMGPNALRAIRPYVKRDTAEMVPGDVYISDGHCFDAEVAHPHHGGAFRPEITPVLDVVTRRCVGWSAALAESTWAVADALRTAVLTGGVPAIYYADRGSGQDNQAFNDPLTGMLPRLGIRRERSIARNSQARGVIEAFHRTLIRAAKDMPTYIGADMDKDAAHRVHKITRRDLKLAGRSRLLMPWPDFVAYVQSVIDAYNDRPHSSLPKVRDVRTGKMRHQTPNEAWAGFEAQGWAPVTVPAEEAEDLFRPYEVRLVSRATVKLFGNTYFARGLEPYHGDQVMVGYDIHDAGRVWVRDLDERLIAVAELDGHARAYFPRGVVDEARTVRRIKDEERARGRLRRLDTKRAEVMAELNGGPALVEHLPEIALPADLAARHAELVESWAAEVEAQPATPERVPSSAPEASAITDGDHWYARARALEEAHAAGEPLDAEDADWLEYARTTSWYSARRMAEQFRAEFFARTEATEVAQ